MNLGANTNTSIAARIEAGAGRAQVRDWVDALAAQLQATGDLTDPHWWTALHDVPRHRFVPARAWVGSYGVDPGYGIDFSADPGQWLTAVYLDTPIITQVDDGAGDAGAGRGSSSSSICAPGHAVDMLERLDLYDQDRVLEIGTGTGWTAGLLSWRVGGENVTSVEIDPQIAADAAANLGAAGWRPTLIVGDGAAGQTLTGGPYDRVLVTCGVTELPYGLVEQTRPGGIIVFPWMPGIGGHNGGHTVKLAVAEDGVAYGQVVGHGSALMMRSHRPPQPAPAGDVREGVTQVDPRRPFNSDGADIFVVAMLPGVHTAITHGSGGSVEVQVWDRESVAQATYQPAVADYPVRQTGPRDLWDELENAFMAWVARGQPTTFGMFISPTMGQRIWAGSPERIIARGW